MIKHDWREIARESHYSNEVRAYRCGFVLGNTSPDRNLDTRDRDCDEQLARKVMES